MQTNQPSKREGVLRAERAAFGEGVLVRRELDVSKIQKGQGDQDAVSEQVSKWIVGIDVAGLGAGPRVGAATIARPRVRSRDGRRE